MSDYRRWKARTDRFRDARRVSRKLGGDGGGKVFGRDEKKIERGTTRKMAIKGEQSFENLIKVRTATYTIESI